MVRAAIDTIDDGIGTARQLVVEATFDQASDDRFAWNVLMQGQCRYIKPPAVAAYGIVHRLDDVVAHRKIAQCGFGTGLQRPHRRPFARRQSQLFQFGGAAQKQPAHFGIGVAAWTQIDKACGILTQAFKLPVKTGPALGIDLAFERGADVQLGARPQFERHPLFRPEPQTFADIAPVNDKIGAVTGNAAHQHMDVRIVGVPMVNGDPVQFGAQILGRVSHQFAGEAAQVFHVPCIFGRDDETKVVPVIFATPCKGIPISPVGLGIEHRGIAPVAGHAVTLKILDVLCQRCGAVMRTFMASDARHNSNAALARCAAHRGNRPTPARGFAAATAAFQTRSP